MKNENGLQKIHRYLLQRKIHPNGLTTHYNYIIGTFLRKFGITQSVSRFFSKYVPTTKDRRICAILTAVFRVIVYGVIGGRMNKPACIPKVFT